MMEAFTSVLHSIYDGFAYLVGLLPFDWAKPDYMKTPILLLLIISPMTAAIGTIVVNARMAFFTSAIGHSAFTGVAMGLLAGAMKPSSMTLVLVLFGCLFAVLLTYMSRRSSVPLDSLVGAVGTLAVAIGIVVITAYRFQRADQFLFGDILFAEKTDLAIAFVTLLTVIGYLAFSYNRLLIIGLSYNLARAWGVRAALYEYSFAVVVAVVVMLSINTVGVLLITAMLIIPAAAGRNFAWNAGSMLVMSVVVSLISAVWGLDLSWRWSSATGASVVFVSGAFLVLSFVVFWLRGRLRRASNQ